MSHDRSSFLGDLETTSTSLQISYSLRVSIPSSEAEYPLARGFVAAVRRSDAVDGTEKLTATCSTCFNPNLPSIKHGASHESSCAIYFRQGKYSFRDDWCRYIIYSFLHFNRASLALLPTACSISRKQTNSGFGCLYLVNASC
ncbi:hypothetical protein M405DRAFT_822411 [Rhizopogon salebrosus TDB-379]|nr:hypothetical protein M405DRAFT_822411 [Rhizopogon salebrosus TDB-379]